MRYLDLPFWDRGEGHCGQLLQPCYHERLLAPVGKEVERRRRWSIRRGRFRYPVGLSSLGWLPLQKFLDAVEARAYLTEARPARSSSCRSRTPSGSVFDRRLSA